MTTNLAEQKNLIRFLLLHPSYLAPFVLRVPSLFVMYLLMRREIRRRGREGRKGKCGPTAARNARLSFERFPVVRRLEAIDSDDFGQMELAGQTISSTEQLNWSYIDEDIEDMFSLNRFGWLFTAIHTRPSAKLSCRALAWIANWIDAMGERFDHPAWESYSVSERLANWPFILRVCEQFRPCDPDGEKKIAVAMGIHIDYLLQNLELRGEATNNHILNNARGLYIGGLAIAHEGAVEKAKELFFDWTPKLFHSDGMLKENSSHYQFLLCQRFEQVSLLSEIADDGTFPIFMKKWTESIQSATSLFNVQSGDNIWAMPLIGDISPDYNPLWFSPLSRKGWTVIKNSYAWGDSRVSSGHQITHEGLRKMCGGFFRYDRDDATVFWHVPEGPVSAGSHGHFDVGSFILFLQGEEIFADSGRRSYNAGGSTGMYAKAHNVLLADGLGPFCEVSNINLIDAYPHQVSHVMVATDPDAHPGLSLAVDGFRRLASPLLWRRSFSFKKRAMTINDDIEAKDDHMLETRFIIPEGLSVEKIDEGVCIKSENGNVSMKVLSRYGEGCPSFFLEKAEISRQYGRAEGAFAFVVRSKTRGNHSSTYTISW